MSKGDPLMRIFDEFDKDHDGHLNAKELAAALRSRKVDISEDQVQQFIEGGPLPPVPPPARCIAKCHPQVFR